VFTVLISVDFAFISALQVGSRKLARKPPEADLENA
jgi:hypothetical protein